MTAAQVALAEAKKLAAAQSTETLVEGFEMTNEVYSAEMSDVRGWIMDELERRNPDAFDAWIESCEDSPRRFFLVA